MSLRLQPSHAIDEKPARGKCFAAICFSWKIFTCLVSHVTHVLLVVSYCVGGAYLFQHLEKPHEIEIKQGIESIRLNLTDQIWKFSNNVSVLSENEWISSVEDDLTKFEKQILTAIKTGGWDGNEDITKTQWTFAGSLFYSIIVITTIGYGHISPRTDWGKVTTIFYAIIGIPLMLLCLSNIGDVMATSFRFLYWRVCCYICTRNARRPRNRSRPRSIRSQRYSSRSQPPPFRRSMKLTQRSAGDSGLGHSIGVSHAYSDPELRCYGRGDYDRMYASNGKRHQRQSMPPPQFYRSGGGGGGRYMPPYYDDQYIEGAPNCDINRSNRFSSRQRNRDRMHDRHTVERERYSTHSRPNFDSMEDLNGPPMPKRTLSVRSVRQSNGRRDDMTRPAARDPRELNRLNSQTMPRGRSVPNTNRSRAKSVDPRISTQYEDIDEEIVRKTPIISNRYAIDELDHPKSTMRSQSMPRSAHLKMSYNNNGDIGPHQHRHHHQQQPQQYNQRESSPCRPTRTSLHRQPSRFGDRLELPDNMAPMHMNHHGGKRGRSPRRDDYDEEYIDERYFDDPNLEDGDYGDCSPRMQRQNSRHRERKQRRERAERLPPSPRIMSPMGFAVKRQIRRRPSYDYEDDSWYGDEWSDYYGDIIPKDRPVPIWLCVFLVVSYILGGAALFAYWEKWSFLDSAYFCFITLTTIGFGDFVPAKGVKDESEQSIAYCSLYLLFGIALLAMSFNLVQEEFITNVKEVARRLGILKDEEDDD